MPVTEEAYVARVALSGQSVFHPVDPDLYWPDEALERRLNVALAGLALNYPLRRRALVARRAVVEALGYTAPPESWKRIRPRVPAQDLEVVVVKAHNVQLWNTDLEAERRFAFIQVGDDDLVAAVRVVRGAALAHLGSGRRTVKRQALVPSALRAASQMGGPADIRDTAPVARLVRAGHVMSITEVQKRVTTLVGTSLLELGQDQERRSGDAVHALVARALGVIFSESGQCPDIPEQLCEVKLSRSPTLDLGAAQPDDTTPRPQLPHGLSYADMRYVVVHANAGTLGASRVIAVTTVTGEQFFSHFRPVAGTDSKLQFALPRDFFPGGLPVVVGREARHLERASGSALSGPAAVRVIGTSSRKCRGGQASAGQLTLF